MLWAIGISIALFLSVLLWACMRIASISDRSLMGGGNCGNGIRKEIRGNCEENSQ